MVMREGEKGCAPTRTSVKGTTVLNPIKKKPTHLIGFLKSRRGIGSRKLPNQNPESRFWKNIKTFSKGIRHEQMHNRYVEQMHKCPRRRILIPLLVNKDPNKDHEQFHQKANQFPLDTILKNEEQ